LQTAVKKGIIVDEVKA